MSMTFFVYVFLNILEHCSVRLHSNYVQQFQSNYVQQFQRSRNCEKLTTTEGQTTDKASALAPSAQVH